MSCRKRSSSKMVNIKILLTVVVLVICTDAATDPSDLAKTAKDGIEAADKALDLYNKILDQVIPWNLFDETIKKLHLAVDHLSDESGNLLAEVKTQLMNGMDQYHSSTQKVFEWSSLASTSLKKYLKLFSYADKPGMKEKVIKAQKDIVLGVLTDGIKLMTAAQTDLHQASMSFNNASGRLTKLNQQLETELTKNSNYYNDQVAKIRTNAYASAWIGGFIGYAVAAGVVEGELIPNLLKGFELVKNRFIELRETVLKATTDIDDTKLKLRNEIDVITDLKTDTVSAKNDIKDLGSFQEFIEESVNKLIASCTKYMERHGRAKN